MYYPSMQYTYLHNTRYPVRSTVGHPDVRVQGGDTEGQDAGLVREGTETEGGRCHGRSQGQNTMGTRGIL